jgi:hypothetical protein
MLKTARLRFVMWVARQLDVPVEVNGSYFGDFNQPRAGVDDPGWYELVR